MVTSEHIEMLKSFIENKVLHEMDSWLEEEWDKMLIDENYTKVVHEEIDMKHMKVQL